MSTPLVVLDSAANPASNLILIGSGYVNALSAQLQSAYNVSMVPTTQIMQAYGTNRVLIAGYYANQTTAAANAFIAQLYAKAAA
jgi:S-layer protein (TIGR01564 family)